MARAKTSPRPRRRLDQLRAPDLPQSEHIRTMSGTTTDEPIVVDDLPEIFPVTGPELNVIETYLGGLIDRLLTRAASDGAVTPASTSNPVMPIGGSRPRS